MTGRLLIKCATPPVYSLLDEFLDKILYPTDLSFFKSVGTVSCDPITFDLYTLINIVLRNIYIQATSVPL